MAVINEGHGWAGVPKREVSLLLWLDTTFIRMGTILVLRVNTTFERKGSLLSTMARRYIYWERKCPCEKGQILDWSGRELSLVLRLGTTFIRKGSVLGTIVRFNI